MGWYLLHLGIGNVVGPPFAGWMYDVTMDYTMSFLFAGCALLITACLLFMQIIYKTCQSMHNKNSFT
ncbi:monocarboxylate transporter 12-B-like [Saccoglossus kowalevskii]